MTNPGIETYLNRYYLHKDCTMPCYYYKEKTMCSLACRSLGKSKKVSEKACIRGFSRLRLQWKETDKTLEDKLVSLMETESFNLHYYVMRLLRNDEDNIGVLIKCILNQKNYPALKHTGVCWYVLLYCLQHIPPTAKVLIQKKQNIVKAFKDSMRTTMTYVTIRVYLSYLGPYFDATDYENMEQALIKMESAEQCFSDFFNGITNYDYTEQFNHYAYSHGYLFFTCFCSRFMRLLLSGNDDGTLENDLKVFNEAIHQTEKLQQLISNIEFKKQLQNLLMQTGKPIPSNVYHHLHQLFSLSWPQFHSRVMTENAVLNEAELESVEKIQLLNIGISAEVFLSRIPDIPSKIVAKIFKREFYKDLGNELRLQMRLQSHPQVAHIHGYIVQGGKYVGILMEYCKGGSMQDVLCETGEDVIDEARALNWLRQAASGLMFLHENNCIHRDVKPRNMLLNKRRTKLKISDLGVMTEVRVNRPGPREQLLQISMKPNSTTGAGAALASEPSRTDGLSGDCGTPGYQAPEILEGEEKATPAVDVFSLGRFIWELVYNRPPTDKLVDDTWGANQGTTTDIYQHKFQPSDELKNLALRMMSPLKKDRPEMREIYQQLTKMQTEYENRLRNHF